ncbi:hypothetical protein F2Q68_00011857 [Brassica cretica]|uniref:Uncharacterized protein n=1 Tax=Brassica cretica TaxID=69181 RepID=A0A8S9L1X5_BRACR|nr:hypothetical protein F2Q68_00011857 [Brassica cretica]
MMERGKREEEGDVGVAEKTRTTSLPSISSTGTEIRCSKRVCGQHGLAYQQRACFQEDYVSLGGKILTSQHLRFIGSATDQPLPHRRLRCTLRLN